MSKVHITIFLSKQEDGSFLAASIDSPRFCVSAHTEAEAAAKAERAFEYHQSNKHKVIDAKPTTTRLIAPAFKEKELCCVN